MTTIALDRTRSGPATAEVTLDPWLGVGAFAVACAFVLAGPFVGATGALVLYVGFNALFNLPHQYCTWVRAVRDPVDPKPNHARRVGLVALLAVAAVALVHSDLLGPTNDALITNALPYWGIWHLVAQHFGISALLRRRGGETVPRGRTLDRAFFATLFALGILRLHADDVLTFRVGASVSSMWRLPLPSTHTGAIATAATVAFALVSVAYLSHAWRANPLRARFQAFVAVATFGAFFLCDDLLLITASITALHNVQYIGLVRAYQSGRERVDGSARALGWRDVGWAAVYSAVVHVVFAVSLSAGQVLLAALVATHYVVDGRLWKFRQDRTLGRYLGVTGA